MSFNPPYPPTNDLTYAYGQLVWQYDGTAGVWNIKDGATVGGVGQKGDQGDPGNAGEAGPRGATGATGVVVMASYTVTGAASFDPRHFVIGETGHVTLPSAYQATGQTVVSGGGSQTVTTSGNIATIDNRIASASLTGVASFSSTYFAVGGNGAVTLASAYQVTGQPVVSGYGINTVVSGNTVIVNNTGVTGFNGLSGNVSITGAGALVGRGNNIIDARLASASVTGVASFNSAYLTVSNGEVSLASAYQATGQTVVSGGSSQLVSTSGNIATIDNRVATSSLTGVASFNSQFFTVSATGHVKQSGGYDIGIQTKTHQIPFMDAGGTSLSGDPCLLFNGTALTFGGSITKMTITGPSLVLGYSTAITGGIFMTPAESARYTDNGVSNTLTITPTNGTVQRFKIAPTTNVTVEAGTGWHTVAGTTETICVIVQSTNGQTGIFSSNILTSTTKPVLFGTTGGIDVFTVMRVAIDATKGLTMAFQTAKGMTAANFNING